MPVSALRTAAMVVVCLFGAASTFAAPPTIADMDIRGLQIGATTTIRLQGANLGPDARLLIPHANLQATIVETPGVDPSQALTIAVNVDAKTPPGVYPMWLATPRGVSNPLAISIDGLPQATFREQVDALPIALHGRLQGETILTTKIPGRAGMRLVVEAQSRRLGANTRMVLRLLDERGNQVEWGEGLDRLSGDPRVEAVLPADGMYTIQIHDVLYRGEAPGHFSLLIGELSYADLVFPLGVQRGQTSEFELLEGNLAGSKVALSGSTEWLFDSMPVTPSAAQYSGSTPRVVVSDHVEAIEPPATGSPVPLSAAPVAVSGRLQAEREEDQYLLPVQPGTTLRFELLAERVGSPLDAILILRDTNGNELARSDDQPGTPDPGLDFAVPANVNQVTVTIIDLLKRGGQTFVYRLHIRDASRPRFNLAIDADRITIPAGGSQTVRVTAQRMGYGGPIALRWEGLPPEVQISGQPLAAGVDTGLVVLRAPPIPIAASIVRVIGTATEGDTPYSAIALVPDTFRAETHPWNRQYLAVANGESSSLQLALSGNPPETLLRGGKLALPFTVSRAAGVTGKVRVRLQTTQPPPKKKITENNQEREVDDPERALRLEADVVVDAAANEGVAPLLVPGDLPENVWTLVLVGELLGPDDSTVLATVSSDALMLPAITPVRIELASAHAIEAKAGLGETGKFAGRIVRLPGFDQPITVTLTGLPAEYPAPSTQIAADQESFELNVAFPYGAPAAELKNVQLVADAGAPAGGAVRSAGVPVEIKVVAGDKPPVEPPLAIFEDEEAITTLLSKGNGQISLEPATKYSGQASVKVTPDQRFSEQLPMLGVRIRENPGAGEFRYLRFAWRKSGGQAICLQLNHDGTWGPGGSGREGAKFRYHAGPVPEVFGGSLALDQNLPTEFVVVTRDLFADFGEFTLNGIALSPVDGEYALFDHIYLGRSMTDFEAVMPK